LTKEVADLRSTVLIRGESGTGKELVARAVHFSGNRAEKPFIVVSCAALTETLLESELFGYEKGAFTGAAAQTKGKFEMANGGTIFLDEIGDISPKLQADLLRVLQERRFYRLGGTQEVEVDVRIIAATNKDLAEEVQAQRFREDLYYRLNVIEIHLPPLRQRREDIPLLAEHFVQHISSALGRDVSGISAAALKLLIAYDWPGNVRELENVIERAIVTCRNGTLDEQDFSWMQRNPGQAQNWEVPDVSLGELERRAIVAALERKHGNAKRRLQRLESIAQLSTTSSSATRSCTESHGSYRRIRSRGTCRPARYSSPPRARHPSIQT
jgi:transcriptional regulator with GAF, ATPase, and Fis domain